jgi:hypothetical protein
VASLISCSAYRATKQRLKPGVRVGWTGADPHLATIGYLLVVVNKIIEGRARSPRSIRRVCGFFMRLGERTADLLRIAEYSDRLRSAGSLPAQENAAGMAALRRLDVAVFCNPL